MATEPTRDDITLAFQRSYQHIVEQAPTGAEWPLAPKIERRGPIRQGGRPAWTLAVLLLVATFGFGAGWLLAPQSRAASEPFVLQTVPPTTAVPSPQAPTEDFPNPREAAIAAALAQDPSLENPSVSRMVVIYADSTIVDLRVQVQAGGFCHWYGVVGRVDNGELRWDGGPAIACEG